MKKNKPINWLIWIPLGILFVILALVGMRNIKYNLIVDSWQFQGLESELVITRSTTVSTIARSMYELDPSMPEWVLRRYWHKSGMVLPDSGRVDIWPFMSLSDLKISMDHPRDRKVSFSSAGWSNEYMVAHLLQREGVCDSAQFVLFVQDNRWEGWLYPGVYWFWPDQQVPEAMAVFAARTRQEIGPLFAERGIPFDKDNPKVKKVMCLAAIVEWEAKHAEEKIWIAGVYWNRLDIGMRLQADPPSIYGNNRVNNHGRWRVNGVPNKVKTDWNTYMVKGCGPTPICSPTASSVEATIYPVPHKFYYFRTRGGKDKFWHRFSRSFDVHKVNGGKSLIDLNVVQVDTAGNCICINPREAWDVELRKQ